jgi:hypothetical protein
MSAVLALRARQGSDTPHLEKSEADETVAALQSRKERIWTAVVKP